MAKATTEVTLKSHPNVAKASRFSWKRRAQGMFSLWSYAIKS